MKKCGFEKKCCKDDEIKKNIYGPRGLRGEDGERGPTGPTGATGPTGPTGERGPSGEEVVVRSTTTTEAGEEASVTSEQIGNTTYLDFYIPKGTNGVPEKVTVGTTTSVEAGEEAKVVDRVEGDVHFFDFSIPKGEKGEKGDMGERGLPGEIGVSPIIVIDGTHTVGPDEPAEVQEDVDGKFHHLTFYIPKGETGAKGEQGDKGEKGDKGEQGDKGDKGDKGEQGDKGDTGPQGEQGEAGPPGLTPDYSLTIVNNSDMVITKGGDLVLPNVEMNNNFSIVNGKVMVPETGTYLVSLSVSNALNPALDDYVAFVSNDIAYVASKCPIPQSGTSSKTIVALLNKNDELVLRAFIDNTLTLNSVGGPSATLTLALISI